ncbi:hypothetical protein [Natrononativus amylolyticus]|uniref:hypothetical protein n=1 Tax=Natrononativus amylolyticus TaxID=2963434 RepID=UPI0020CEE342|nr:hypothetical protein [Natrononativus amylolyticus]
MLSRRRFLILAPGCLGAVPGCSLRSNDPESQPGSPLSEPVELNEIRVMSSATAAATIDVRVVDDGSVVFQTPVDLEGRDPDSREMPTEVLSAGWPSEPMEIDVQARVDSVERADDADAEGADDAGGSDEWWGLSESEVRADVIDVSIGLNLVSDGLSVAFDRADW